jgi:DNA-binding NarL/FixJ family response regulator
VVLADDHGSLRRSLRLLLEREGDLEVVAEASDLPAAIREVAAHRPDVLVVDARLPDGSSADRIGRLRAPSPRTGVVVISMHDSAVFAEHAFKAGALGFVLIDDADQELPDAVRRVAEGHVYRSQRLRQR